jgi:hypothetical protein
MATRAELDFIEPSLRRHGTIELSAVVALEILGQAHKKIDFEETLEAIRTQPVDSVAVAEKVLRGSRAARGVVVTAKFG